MTFRLFDFLTFLFAGLALSSATVTAGGSPEPEPDDRLPRQERRLVAGLIQRGMPELVKEMLAGRPPRHRVYLARAYAKAGADAKRPTEREQFFTHAAKEYRRVIALGRKRGWLRGERRRLNLAQWRVEFGDMILRHWIAADLDRFEITSGLDFRRKRLLARLKEAVALYTKAGKTLRHLDLDLRTDEDRYLLLGIVDKIATVSSQQQLNIAWAWLYLAMVSEPDAGARLQRLADALGAFDLASRNRHDPEQKYNALLGAGIALRELGRFGEAGAAFDRILSSTASRALTARAGYEKARALMRAERFEAARAVLQQLGLQPTRRLGEAGAGALFYIRLAPLIHAYTYLLESRVTTLPPDRRAALVHKAQSELVELIDQGGAWPQMAQVYMDAIIGTKRNLDQLTPVELVLLGDRLMSRGEYDRAIEAWRRLLGRKQIGSRRHQARLNLGVCYFQTSRTRAAAEVFLTEAQDSPPPAIAAKVVDYAYRCWRQLAARSESRDDYLKLAEAAELLSEASPKPKDAAEAGWVAALAWQEAGEYRQAERAYRRVRPTDANYWQARRNISRCRQRFYETLPKNSTSVRRRASARKAVDAWLELADDLAALPSDRDVESKRQKADSRPARSTAKDSPAGDPKTRKAWIIAARLAAATILAGDDLRDYKPCLALLDEMPATARVLGLRIRCFQGLGDIQNANRVLDVYLQRDSGVEAGSLLVGLAAEMESEIKRLEREGRQNDAKRMAIDTLPALRHLLDWIRSQPSRREQVPVVEFSLLRTLVQAGQADEAVRELDDLMTEHPDNGAYVRTAALLQEKIAQRRGGPARDAALDDAESLWTRLLQDPSLRRRAPAEYWEARYHWLKHQLRHGGRAAEVLRGIESDKAWHPDLGGPPWHGRLLQLAEQARSQNEAPAP